LHHEQDEWFYVVEGEYVIEVGEERYEPGPGDSVLAPRKVAHVWARVGEGTGRLIAALQPAGEIEAFFEDVAKLGTSPSARNSREAFSSHSMELAGPPFVDRISELPRVSENPKGEVRRTSLLAVL
jgi:quercetin 2,3-dioxygenase